MLWQCKMRWHLGSHQLKYLANEGTLHTRIFGHMGGHDEIKFTIPPGYDQDDVERRSLERRPLCTALQVARHLELCLSGSQVRLELPTLKIQSKIRKGKHDSRRTTCDNRMFKYNIGNKHIAPTEKSTSTNIIINTLCIMMES